MRREWRSIILLLFLACGSAAHVCAQRTVVVRNHISSFNAKSSPVPEAWEPLVNEWIKKMGYRFVLRKFSYPETVKRNGKLEFKSWWENKGVAPIYKKFPLAIRIRNKEEQMVFLTGADIREWLPGDNIYDAAIFVPANAKPGEYDVQLALVDPVEKQPKVSLAIEGRDDEGWYTMGKISVEEGQPCFSCENPPVGTVFCDDFENPEPLRARYFEYNDRNGAFVRAEGVGTGGSAGMRARFRKGQVDAGALKKSIGRSEDPYLQATSSMPEETFTELYWRIDLRYQDGWIGGGADKLTRATTLFKGWKQGMIAHVWSGGKPDTHHYLVIDPASGIDGDGKIVSTRYNDFANLRWLGNQRGTTDLFSDENAGKWHCVVAHIKLNTPGKSDGLFELWINDKPQARKENINWHGTYNRNPESFGVNAVFFENYWNAGSPQDQERYFDNIVISTRPLKCDCQ